MAIYLAGLGCTTGDILGSVYPLLTTPSSKVWWVHYTNGTDDAAHGITRDAPFKTLAYAVSACSDGDIIVLMNGHDESVAGFTITNSIAIIGESSSQGIPSASITSAGESPGITLAIAPKVLIGNIRFKAGSQSSIVFPNDSYLILRGNRFECGHDDVLKVTNSAGTASGCLISEANTWISTTTDPVDLPHYALQLVDGPGLIKINGDIFDGGLYGWELQALELASAPLVFAENLSFLRGADMSLPTTGLYYWITAPNSSGVVAAE